MASLRKLPTSPYWIACISLPDGRRTSRSTGTSDRRKARRIADVLEGASREAREGRLTDARARRAVADIYAVANRCDLPRATVRGLMDSWLKQKGLEGCSSTYRKYLGVARDFLGFLGRSADRELQHLSAKDLMGYWESVCQRATVGTANLNIRVLRSALQRAVRNGLIDTNPADHVTLPTADRTLFRRRPFTRDEVAKLLSVADEQWRGVILLAVYTGQRLGDLVSLRWSDVELANKEVALFTQKTGRRQVLPLHDSIVRHLSSLPQPVTPEAPLFPTLRAIQERSGATGALSKRFHELQVEAGLAPKRERQPVNNGRSGRRALSELSFHSLRHTATAELKSAGVSDAVAMDLVGHESRAMSRHYTRIDMQAKRDAVGRLPDLRSLPQR